MAAPRPPHDPAVLALSDAAVLATPLVIRLLPSWAALTPADVAVTPVSGGITNALFKARAARAGPPCTPPLTRATFAQLTPPPGLGAVVLRVFGANTELFVDRARELEVLLQLTACGFGAPVLATFANGRVEAWLEGARPLEPAELSDPALVPCVAAALRRLHGTPVAVPGGAVPQLWPQLRQWLGWARELRLEPEARQRALEALDLDAVAALLAEVEAACAAVASPVLFCHNDLLSGNVLVGPGPPGTAALHLIDFEYGAPNFRGFDLGNHFNEWAGFECDYSRFPDAAQMRAFLAAYAAAGPGPAGPEAVEALVVEAQVFSLASHLYWGIWALIQAKHSAIDFDYLGYHTLRLDELRRRKAAVLALLPPRG